MKDLEKQLSLLAAATPSSSSRTFQSIYSEPENAPASEFGLISQDGNLVEFSPLTSGDLGLSPTSSSPVTNSNDRARDRAAASLATELEVLSLEATAERHLGSSSGVSFAKLTQAVLRRLSPDKSSFVFEDDPEPEPRLDADPLSTQSIDSIGAPDLNFLSFSSPSAFNAFSSWEQLGTSEPSELIAFPPQMDTARLTDFYWAHSHTLYPIIHKNEFMSVLQRIYEDPEDPHAQSPLWLFRIWMVLAIGSTAYSSVSLVDESESVIFFNKAMTYFEGALGCGDMVRAASSATLIP